MLFVLGFGLVMLGVTLLVLGEVKLPGGRVLRRRPARVAGVVLLSFVPLVIGARVFLHYYDREAQLQGEHWAAVVRERYLPALDWGLFGLCLVLAAWIVLRGSRPLGVKRPRAGGLGTGKNPFAVMNEAPAATTPESGALEATPPLPPAAPGKGKKPVRRPKGEENPFDFT